MRIDQAVNIEDLHQMAKRRLPKVAFDFIEGGLEDERSLERNTSAFQKHLLLPRYLVDVSKRDQTQTIFGQTFSSPFGISPTGGAGLLHLGLSETSAAAALSGRCFEARPDADDLRPDLFQPVRYFANRRCRAVTPRPFRNICCCRVIWSMFRSATRRRRSSARPFPARSVFRQPAVPGCYTAAFQKHLLLPRYLVDVSKRDQTQTIFGQTFSSPFGISPTGGAGLFRRGLSETSAAAALSGRCFEARPDADDLRPDLFQPVRYFANRRGRAVPPR